MMKKFSEWMTPERSIALQGLGQGLSQLANGQPVNMSSAHQALMERQKSEQMRRTLADSGLMDRFTADQRKMLAMMPPAAAQQVLAQSLFAPKPAPVEGKIMGDRLVNPITGEEMAHFPSAAKPVVVNGHLVDPETGRVIAAFPDAEKPVTQSIVIGPDDPLRVHAGLPNDDKSYAVKFYEGPDGARVFTDHRAIGTPLVDMTGESTQAKEFAKLQVGLLRDIYSGTASAKEELGQIGVISALLDKTETGATASWANWVQNNLGLPVAGSEVEALDAAINKLVPQQRVPGSGTMSDADLQLFRQSLPQLINSPEGNRIIVDTMRALAEHKNRQYDIAGRAMTEELTTVEAFKELRELPDPLEGLADRIRNAGAGSGGSTPASGETDSAGLTQEDQDALAALRSLK